MCHTLLVRGHSYLIAFQEAVLFSCHIVGVTLAMLYQSSGAV